MEVKEGGAERHRAAGDEGSRQKDREAIDQKRNQIANLSGSFFFGKGSREKTRRSLEDPGGARISPPVCTFSMHKRHSIDTQHTPKRQKVANGGSESAGWAKRSCRSEWDWATKTGFVGDRVAEGSRQRRGGLTLNA